MIEGYELNVVKSINEGKLIFDEIKIFESINEGEKVYNTLLCRFKDMIRG